MHVNSCLQNKNILTAAVLEIPRILWPWASWIHGPPPSTVFPLISVWIHGLASLLQRLSVEDFISPSLISAHKNLKSKLAWLIGEKQVFFFVDMADSPGVPEQEDRTNAPSVSNKAVEGRTNTHYHPDLRRLVPWLIRKKICTQQIC